MGSEFFVYLRSVRTLSATLVVAMAACDGSHDETAKVEAARQAAAASLGAVQLDLPPRALPAGSVAVRVTATISGVSRRTTPLLRFTGDVTDWAAADLPVTSRSGDRFTFGATLAAPAGTGVHTLSWSLLVGNTIVGAPIVGDLEVTCSDGDFCNGEERFTRLGCVSGPPPCDDGENCTRDSCDAAARTCAFDPQGAGCNSCDNGNCNPHCGPHQDCGDDGCGGVCRSAETDAAGGCTGGRFCVAGVCESIEAGGTCGSPFPLFGAAGTVVPPTGIETSVFGDTSTGYDLVKVSCGGEGIKEVVYRFDVPVKMGLEIRMLSASGDPNAMDTVLAVHRDDCTTQEPFGGFCSDDASPPGGLGSRVYGPLDPGSYRLIATGYSASQVGPFQLQVKFAAGCVPACDGKFCGPDGCGDTCGDCDAGLICSDSGRCRPVDCVPDCKQRECGDDGCGAPCGACGAGELCAEVEGKCVAGGTCDHLKPVCKNCSPKDYCGADCACHKVDEVLIDLVPAPAATLLPSIEFEWRTFDVASCALAESCVPGPGRWLLMRFSTDILNQGLAGFKPGDPTQMPDMFSYHECHQHYHFSGFAQYGLLSESGDQIMTGRKLSYCMEDSYQHLLGPNIPCEADSTCDDQGIQAGWADSYPATLDCQWLVLRGSTASPNDVPSGQWYMHETCTNTGRAFHEASFDNNCIRVPVYIPDVPDNGAVLRYSDLNLPPAP